METSGASERHSTEVSRSVRSGPVLAGVLVLGMAVNLGVTRGQIFFSDEWSRLILDHGSSLTQLLRGHSGHLVVLHSLLYKGLFTVFGADSYLPFRVAEAMLLGLAGLLFFALVRSEDNPWPAVLATSLLLLLGSAWEVLATPWGTIILLPIVLGLAALLLVRLETTLGDLLACCMLIGAVASQSTGLAFLAGAACALLLGPRRRAIERSWIVLVPLVLYVAWFAWSRSTGVGDAIQDPVHASNIIQVPSAMASVASAGLAAGTGFFGESRIGTQSFNLTAGYLILGFAIVGIAYRGRQRPRVRPVVLVPVALALTFWALVAFVVEPPFRPPEAARYLFPSVVFLLLILLELTAGLSPNRATKVAAVGAFLVALVPNAANLVKQGNDLRRISADERVVLGSLELMREELPPDQLPGLSAINGPGLALDDPGQFSASEYFAATDDYGSPATVPDQLIGATDFQKLAVDRTLLDQGDLGVSPAPSGVSTKSRHCIHLDAGSEGFTLPAKPLYLLPAGGGTITVTARRFGSAFQTVPGSPSGTGIAVTGASTPGVPTWRLSTRGNVIACAAPTS